MAKKTGMFAKVVLDVDGTPTDVLHLREWSISVSTNKIDSSAATETWDDHLIGRKSWEGEATVIDADKFWLDMIDSKITIDFFDHEDDVDPIYTGQASLDFERGVPHDDIIETSLTFTGAGELTHPASAV